jgi:hypothetical protein
VEVALGQVAVVHMDFQLVEQVGPLLALAHRNQFLCRYMYNCMAGALDIPES